MALFEIDEVRPRLSIDVNNGIAATELVIDDDIEEEPRSIMAQIAEDIVSVQPIGGFTPRTQVSEIDKMFEDVLSDMNNNVVKPTLIEKPILRGHFTQIEELFRMFRQNQINAFICGGYVRWACSPLGDPAPTQDMDVYCETDADFNKAHALFNRNNLRAKMRNSVSVTYHRGKLNGIFSTLPPIQLIKPIQEGRMVTTGCMTDVLANFDFSIIRCGFDEECFSRKVAMCDVDFAAHETTKVLVLKNIHCPISSMFRCIKYTNRGYRLSTHEMLKLFVDWETRTPEYREKIKSFFVRMNAGQRIDATEFNAMYRSMRVD